MKFLHFFLGLFLVACTNEEITNQTVTNETFPNIEENEIICSKQNCSGCYSGPEFVDGSDVAHQFSNKMSEKVGDQLKELYHDGEYSKVDFSKIEVSTKGMGSGKVVYKLVIPFIRVDEKCVAYTSFDHVGGWNHAPALEGRTKQLQKALIQGEQLDVSGLKSTPEGLQEYWIQWKNKDVQFECAGE